MQKYQVPHWRISALAHNHVTIHITVVLMPSFGNSYFISATNFACRFFSISTKVQCLHIRQLRRIFFPCNHLQCKLKEKVTGKTYGLRRKKKACFYKIQSWGQVYNSGGLVILVWVISTQTWSIYFFWNEKFHLWETSKLSWKKDSIALKLRYPTILKDLISVKVTGTIPIDSPWIRVRSQETPTLISLTFKHSLDRKLSCGVEKIVNKSCWSKNGLNDNCDLGLPAFWTRALAKVHQSSLSACLHFSLCSEIQSGSLMDVYVLLRYEAVT